MALKIENEKIVGTIDNLEDKLNGEIPVTREELLLLVSSWGRRLGFATKDSQNKDIYIGSCEATQSEQALLVRTQSEQTRFVRKECYDLSKLDVSQITNMDSVFCFSNFNGDISNWDVSNVTNMLDMFFFAKDFNQPINDWDVSNVTNMSHMFYEAKIFNQNISNWDVSNVDNMDGMFRNAEMFNQPLNFDTSNVTSMKKMFCHAKKFNQPLIFDTSNVVNMDYMFNDAKSFLDRYNSGKDLPYYTNEIKDWINNNRDKMNEIDIKENHGKEINDFFNIISNTKKIIF